MKGPQDCILFNPTFHTLHTTRKHTTTHQLPQVIELLPMTPSEAIDAMEGLGHDFFVFRDRNSNTIQVMIT